MKTKLFLLFAILNLNIGWTQTFKVDGINYNIIPNTTNVEVGQNESSATSLTIPSTVEYNEVSYLVTSIKVSAFYKNTTLTSIIIPISVTVIGNNAFYECSNLTNIIIPNSVISIGNSVFYKCKSLNNVILPNRLPSIGNATFADCSGLTAIKIPNSVTAIGYSAFKNCKSLQILNTIV